MMDYTYRVRRVSCRGGRTVLAVVDLGFGLPKQHEFLLLGISENDEQSLRSVVGGSVKSSDEVVLRSIKRADGVYYADITYLWEGAWCNLSREILRTRKEVE